MLQEESTHNRRQDEEPPVNKRPKCNARERHGRRIGFERSLDVPFVIKLVQTLLDGPIRPTG